MKLVSIHVGKPKLVKYKDQEVSTGIFKERVDGPVLMRTLNLEGDGQADLKVHGGPHKAVYAYPFDAYPAWQAARPQDGMKPGMLGENLSIDPLPEDQLCIGDTFELGEAIVQISKPRMPCYKLVVKFQDPKILKDFMKIGRPGLYFRVLKEGLIEAGQELKLISKAPDRYSILQAFNDKS